MVIRKYEQSDLHEIASLIRDTFRKFNFNDNDLEISKKYTDLYDTDKNLENIKYQFNTTTVFLVAEKQNQIVGTLRAIDNRIINLFVREKCHNQGIGKRLVTEFEIECKKRGFSEIILRSQTFAIPFYLSCGYVHTSGFTDKFGLSTQAMKKSI